MFGSLWQTRQQTNGYTHAHTHTQDQREIVRVLWTEATVRSNEHNESKELRNFSDTPWPRAHVKLVRVAYFLR